MSLQQVAVSHRVDEATRNAYSARLGARAQLAFLHGMEDNARARAIGHADVLACFSLAGELSDTECRSLNRVRFVQCLAAGMDRFPFDRLPPATPVAFNPGASARPIAEHALALTLSAAKRLPECQRMLASGAFEQLTVTTRLEGGTAVILGFGAIGQATGALLRAFGMTIIAVNRSGRCDSGADRCVPLESLDDVLPLADVLIISIALGERTLGLIGERELRRMKPTAILVNVSRAHVVRQRDLYMHLSAHPRFTACLDVWWVEPLYDDTFVLEYPFFSLPNLIGSPHNAPMVPGVLAEVAGAASANIERFLAGNPPRHLATPADRAASDIHTR